MANLSPVRCTRKEREKEGPGFKGDRHYIQIFRDTNTYWQRVPWGKTFTSLPLHSPPLSVRQVHRGIASEEKRQKQLSRRGNGREHSLGLSPAVKEGVLTQMASLWSRPLLYESNWISRTHERRERMELMQNSCHLTKTLAAHLIAKLAANISICH